jgi:hypothetical protein
VKRLLTYEQINEKILNRKLAQFEVDKMIKEISEIIPIKEENYYDYPIDNKNIYFVLHFRKDELKHIKNIDKIISKYKNIIFPKINFMALII